MSSSPIFPLPNVVLFPNVFLPLHIFEPRYREMVADALDSDRMIGMVLLQPGWEHEYEGRPPRLSDRLQRRHHARRSADRRPLQHRVARRRALPHRRRGPQPRATGAPWSIRWWNARSSPRIARCSGGSGRSSRRWSPRDRAPARAGGRAAGEGTSTVDAMIPPGMADEDLVNALAQYLDLEPLEKQALLERHCLRSPRRVAGRAARDEDAASPARRAARRSRISARRWLHESPRSRRSSRRARPAPAIVATIFSPWKRPFSMKMLLVSLPEIAPPARNSPGTLVSNVSGS